MKITTNNLPQCNECSIRKAALFGEMKTEHLDQVRQLRTCQVTYSANEYLYHEGDTPSRTYTVYKGWIALFKILADGSRQILYFALPGDLICFKAKKESLLDHTAIAISDVTLCSFPTERVRQTIAELPELAFAISSINELFTERCHLNLTTIASYSAETKVAYLLLSLYLRESAINTYPDGYVAFPVTQEDIGDALGLTAIHVNRVYQGLRKKGLIECKRRYLRIIDIPEMERVANVDQQSLRQLMYVV